MKLQSGIASVPPASQAHFWIEFGPGHFVHYRDMMDCVDQMNQRRQQFAAASGIDFLNVGETLDIFGGEA